MNRSQWAGAFYRPLKRALESFFLLVPSPEGLGYIQMSADADKTPFLTVGYCTVPRFNNGLKSHSATNTP